MPVDTSKVLNVAQLLELLKDMPPDAIPVYPHTEYGRAGLIPIRVAEYTTGTQDSRHEAFYQNHPLGDDKLVILE